MIINKYHCIILIICSLLYSCIANRTMKFKPFIDPSGLTVVNNISKINYFCVTTNNERIIAPINGIEFLGGNEALKNYLDSIYYNHPTYNGLNTNLIEFFYILFDESLNIKEVRVLEFEKRSKEYEYIQNKIRTIYKDALLNSKGLWIKRKMNSKWYIYIHRHTIK